MKKKTDSHSLSPAHVHTYKHTHAHTLEEGLNALYGSTNNLCEALCLNCAYIKSMGCGISSDSGTDVLGNNVTQNGRASLLHPSDALQAGKGNVQDFIPRPLYLSREREKAS